MLRFTTSKKHLQNKGWSIGNKGLGVQSHCTCWKGCALLSMLVYLVVSKQPTWSLMAKYHHEFRVHLQTVVPLAYRAGLALNRPQLLCESRAKWEAGSTRITSGRFVLALSCSFFRGWNKGLLIALETWLPWGLITQEAHQQKLSCSLTKSMVLCHFWQNNKYLHKLHLKMAGNDFLWMTGCHSCCRLDKSPSAHSVC